MCSRKTIFLDLRRYCCYPTTTSVPQTTTYIAERFRFHKRHQLEGETVSAYLAELKTLSLHCEFGTNLDDSLRDRLVCGLNNALIQKRLLSERDLTLAKATQIALSMEAAAKDSLELQGKNESVVNKLNKEKGKVENVRDEVWSKRRCYRCGSNLHSLEECHFKNANCRKCGKVGHIQRVCRSGRNQQTTDREKHGTKNWICCTFDIWQSLSQIWNRF